MRIAFLDTSGWSYDATTPYDEPMGGSQSALCYLAMELAKLGHQVTVYNGNRETVQAGDLTFLGCPAPARLPLIEADILIVLNVAIGQKLRDAGVKLPMILWNHHAVFQDAIRPLKALEEQSAWSRIVFVSETQREPYLSEFNVPKHWTHVMHNGVSPAFEDVALPAPWFETGEPPVLFYTSTPFRGLDVLLDAFPEIRRAIPGTRLKVFSSMAVYRQPESQFRALYAKARSMDGVAYVGSLGQRELATQLAGCAALAHPSTFPECHSIAALEAMTVGAAVYTTDLGGQRETTGGLAEMIPAHGDKAKLAQEFADMVIGALTRARDNPALAAVDRQMRLRFIREGYLWRDRAKAWVNLLAYTAGATGAQPRS